MAYFVIEDFRAGLDTRRMPELSVPGSLLVLKDAHINRGGEIEKRLAFVPQLTMPVGTHGLAAVSGTLFTFGSAAPETIVFPANTPSNLVYQQLSAPGALDMAEVVHASAFDGKPYVIARYADGSTHHFYNGVLHTEFVEARARAGFTITGGSAGGAPASASFQITGGINAQSDLITYIRAGTLPILTQPVQHVGNNDQTATAVAAAINAFEGNPDFTAAAVGSTVTVTAVDPGTKFNGLALNITKTGGFTVAGVLPFAGGVDNAITDLVVDGVRLIDEPVLHTGDNEETAALLAAAINDYPSAPDYIATVVGAKINILIETPGAANNGKAVAITATGDVTLDDTSLVLADGADLVTTVNAQTYLSGDFAKPAKSKMYSISGSLVHFSGISEPLEINDVDKEAGFINLSSNAEGSERLNSIANYQTNLAFFSERTIQVYFVDVTSAGNQQLQVLNNTGAIAPQSVQEIGDSDVFYLSESGIRSLRARDSSNAAFSSDIGNSIDMMILDEINSNRVAAQRAKAVLEPRDGRYMMALGKRIYVFSYFPASKVSAWSTYEPGFGVDAWAIIGRRLYCRGDDGVLYILGGKDGKTYDDTQPEALIPFVDAGAPATTKSFHGFDTVCTGNWTVSVGPRVTDIDAEQVIAYINETTYESGSVSYQVESTHLALRLRATGGGPAKMGSLAIHYDGGAPS